MAIRSRILGRLFDQPSRYLDNPSAFFDPRYHLGLGGMGGGAGHSYGFGTFVPDVSGLSQLASIASSRAQQTGRPVVVQGPKQDTQGDDQKWKHYLGAQALLEKQSQDAQRARQFEEHQNYLQQQMEDRQSQFLATEHDKVSMARLLNAGKAYQLISTLGLHGAYQVARDAGYGDDFIADVVKRSQTEPDVTGLPPGPARAMQTYHRAGMDLLYKPGDLGHLGVGLEQYEPDLYGERQGIHAQAQAWQAGASEAAKLPYQKQLEDYRQKGRLGLADVRAAKRLAQAQQEAEWRANEERAKRSQGLMDWTAKQWALGKLRTPRNQQSPTLAQPEEADFTTNPGLEAIIKGAAGAHPGTATLPPTNQPPAALPPAHAEHDAIMAEAAARWNSRDDEDSLSMRDEDEAD